MTINFAPRLDILPPPQRRLWDELVAVPREFVLYGGTALALHLGHRESLDFDFFGNKPLDPAKLVPAVSFLVGAIVTQREPNTFSCTVDRGGVVKLSFFGLPGIPHLSPPLIAPDNDLCVSIDTVARFERGDELKERTIDALQRALEAAGVEFTNGDQPGVRLTRAAAARSAEAAGVSKPSAAAKAVRGQTANAPRKKR